MKIKVFQLLKTKHIRKTILSIKSVEIANFKYITVDEQDVEIIPEYVLLTRDKKDYVPCVFLDSDYILIHPNKLSPPALFGDTKEVKQAR